MCVRRRTKIKDLRNFRGLPVIYGGRRIGRAASVELSEDLTYIRGLNIDCGMRGSRFVPVDDVRLIGDVSIIIDSDGKRCKRGALGIRRRAVSTDGRLVGAVSGAMIDEDTGRVEALLLSQGYIDDLISGRQWVRQFSVNLGSGDVILGEGGTPE